ncbi:YolD-like family protein [Paenibacillus sp. UMB4589-SE434]|uniref:YolD-like family protein n=1 Tax=Paenibacillus sp. UMB4589-SE434 TaxID=3046314 RepID=UPI002550266E|nr:YolD-like family protein [Paenibacillus sp. UMB4589-SE434]MDK8182141.1 YolD-like family protein [Paenibacillus sp. UMB4589-SE434]
MAGKLQDNGLWESSRMIIPEHKVAMLEYARKREHKSRPQLDDQELELIGGKLYESMRDRQAVQVEVFDPFRQLVFTGMVIDIDLVGKRVKLLQDDEWQWIKVENILSIS